MTLAAAPVNEASEHRTGPDTSSDVEDLHFSDEEYKVLVERCLAGDSSATELLYRALWQRGEVQIHHFVSRQDLAEDVVAKTLQKLLGPAPVGMVRALEQYDSSRPFTNWFDRIVATKAIDFLRTERRRQEREEVAASRRPERHEDPTRVVERGDQVQHAMRNLTNEERELLELWMRGWDYESIATVLGIRRPGTVGSRLASIKLKIRRDIDGGF